MHVHVGDAAPVLRTLALSPLYDVSTGLGYPHSSELAMGFGGEKEIRKVTGCHLLQFARDVGVDGEHVLDAARAMTALMPFAFAAAVADTRATAEIGVEDQARLNRTSERLSAHCQHVETMLERTT